MIYNWEEDEGLRAAKERMKTYSVEEQGRLQAISDWIWEYKSFVDTQWADMPKLWKDAYIKSFDECMETEKRERENGQAN